jgi:flagellar motor switch protein FliG
MTTVDSPFPTPTVRRRSLSELVEFEDLGFLDSSDLRAVFSQVSETQIIEALIGVPVGLRQLLLTKLPGSVARALESQLDSYGPVPFATVQGAQRTLVEILCRLSRAGQVAFDDPEDMVA